MSKFQLNIPETLKIGLRKRTGTYDGHLSYVTYIDNKGKLRKEHSWNGWRDHQIAIKTFENVPVDGFVLNKKVGETRYGWNPRRAWIRIYDPRGFEFEISTENLIFILEECSSIKGKGIEGELIYAWDKADLVLLPVSSLEYKKSLEFTNIQQNKITKKDMKEGCIYLTKKERKVMYLGRMDYRDVCQNGHGTNKISKSHIFTYVDDINKNTYLYEKYWIQKGFTKIASRLTDEPSEEYAKEYEEYKNSKYAAKIDKLIPETVNLETVLKGKYRYFIKKNNDLYSISVCKSWCRKKDEYYFYTNLNCVGTTTNGCLMGISNYNENFKFSTIKELKKKQFYKLKVRLENGCEYYL